MKIINIDKTKPKKKKILPIIERVDPKPLSENNPAVIVASILFTKKGKTKSMIINTPNDIQINFEVRLDP